MKSAVDSDLGLSGQIFGAKPIPQPFDHASEALVIDSNSRVPVSR
jgi:hypothetical protein